MTRKIPTDDLMDDLQRVTDDLGRSPTIAEYEEHGEYTIKPFITSFGSWNNAKEELDLETWNGQKPASKQALLDDMREVSNELGHSPTIAEYEKHGEYSGRTVGNYFESWNAGKREANLKVETQGSEVRDIQLLIEDLQRVADKLGKPPEVSEYNAHGKWTERAIYNRFDSWNTALDTAGLALRNSRGLTDEDFLRHLRAWWETSQTTTQMDFLRNDTEFSRRSCKSRFGKPWRALVRAGIEPSVAPLSPADYNKYIQTAIDIEDPHLSVMGLLRAFTGIPLPTLTYFDLSWISRVNDDHQPPLLTVPSKYIIADEDWVMILPTSYTIAGEDKSTSLGGMLSWMKNYVEIIEANRKRIDQISDRAGIDTGPESLRASVGAHLARRGMSREKIEMQVGADKLDWWLSIEDFYLYLYQFEGIVHDSYTPSGAYFDPDTGDVTKIDSES